LLDTRGDSNWRGDHGDRYQDRDDRERDDNRGSVYHDDRRRAFSFDIDDDDDTPRRRNDGDDAALPDRRRRAFDFDLDR
jgi:hypothetical protein